MVNVFIYQFNKKCIVHLVHVIILAVGDTTVNEKDNTRRELKLCWNTFACWCFLNSSNPMGLEHMIHNNIKLQFGEMLSRILDLGCSNHMYPKLEWSPKVSAENMWILQCWTYG